MNNITKLKKCRETAKNCRKMPLFCSKISKIDRKNQTKKRQKKYIIENQHFTMIKHCNVLKMNKINKNTEKITLYHVRKIYNIYK